ncbi:hypothetical protein POG22_21750 [Geitlerinema sp. CS-897]|nr:hypothetical protein [Geitlerinema sp. CS-897]
MAVLYTCGNINLNTVKLVATAVKTLLDRDKNQPILKVVVFSSPEINKIFIEQEEIYRNFLGRDIRIEKVSLDSEGLAKAEDFTEVFKNDSLKYVDLTNGQKAVTAQLYLAASLLRIENIYYISLLCSPKEIPDRPNWGQHYEYTKLPPFTGISSISRLSYFDLVFYLEEIDNIFAEIKQISFLHKISNDLRKGVLSFFQGDNFRSAVSDATTSSEVFINELLEFLRIYPPAKVFANDFGIDLLKQKDSLGAISFFFRKYSEMSGKKRSYIDKNLDSLLTIPGLLTPLRSFRNLSAHAGMSSHQFKSNEVRISINLALECFRCAKASEEFWKRLLAR